MVPTSNANAELSGNDVLRDCQLTALDGGTAKAMKLVNCMAYLGGLNDAYTVAFAPYKSTKISAFQLTPRFCPPIAGIPNDQLMLVVKKWLKAHPEVLHMPVAIARF